MAEQPLNPDQQAALDEFVRLGTDEAKLNLLAQVRPASELLQADINAYLGYQAPENALPEYPGHLSGRARDRHSPPDGGPLPDDVVAAVMASRRQEVQKALQRQAAAHIACTRARRDFDRYHSAPVRHYRPGLPWWVTPWTLLLIVFLITLVTQH